MQDAPEVERRGGGRAVWLVMFLAAAVTIPRSVAISRSHSESFDDEYHMTRGLAFLARDLARADADLRTKVNDPPLGEGIVALPLWVDNLARGRDLSDFRPLDHPLGPDFLLGLIAAWKALLFVPLVGIAFAWCRALYGARAAWLAAGLLVVEPTIAGHLPIPALDVLGAESIAIAAFLAWRSFQDPTLGRRVAAGVALAAALAIKHTALVMPPILAGFAAICWGLKPILERRGWSDLPGRIGSHARDAALTLTTAGVALWALLLFDVSPTSMGDLRAYLRQPPPGAPAMAEDAAPRPVETWPAGSYLRSFQQGMKHNQKGHLGFLLGEVRRTGWWYYFPVASSIKLPVGVAAILLLGVASLAWNRPRWGEWGLVVPLLACLALALNTRINIGFRHFLPSLVFLLLFSTRALAGASNRLALGAWAAVVVAAVHSAGFHPDYLSYSNGLRSKPYLALSDSNVDWGQGLKQVRAWVAARPRDGRAVRLGYFGNSATVPRYLGDRGVEVVGRMPSDGVLIVSPVLVSGPYDPEGRYEALARIDPDEVIGHSLLVYDIDRLRRVGLLPAPGDRGG